MMTNLFSSFDTPTNILDLSLNWMSMMIGWLTFWFIPSRFNMMWITVIMTLHKEFKT